MTNRLALTEPRRESAHPPDTGHPAASDAANLRGIVAMLGAMAAFVANDTCVKLASATLPIGEIITLRNGAATVYLAALFMVLGRLGLPPRLPVGLLALRMTGETVSTLLFLAALVSLPLADMTALAQVTPLALTAAAAIFLGEKVGWRRWTATAVGLFGVALIARPGSSSFSLAGAMVLCSVAFVVLRDLATRLISTAVPTLVLTLSSAVSGIFAGLVLAPFETWRVPAGHEAGLLAASGLFLTIGYALIIIALRTGEVAIVSPFRYAVILFALLSGFLVWGQSPDAIAMIGIVIVCSAGLFTVHRERVRRHGTHRA